MDIWQDFCARNDIPERYRNARASNLCIASDQKGSFRDRCRKIINNPDSLLLFGKAGRGKTYFMFALMHGLLTARKLPPGDLRYFRSIDLDAALLRAYADYRNVTPFITEISRVPFLFIDDFGLDRHTTTAERDYYDLIDRRVSHQRVTVMTTNLDSKGLQQIYGERISSRLKEFAGIDFMGPDLRDDMTTKL